MPATATRYTDGKPYKQAVAGYTSDYQPTGNTLSLPADVAAAWGLKTSYSYGYSYTDTGLPESLALPAIGNFPSEKLLAGTTPRVFRCRCRVRIGTGRRPRTRRTGS